ncbi:ABC transporter ATP-binding protein [Eleftheria terrae]|uniref:ABC transporter ATP-binding protein n=1 Tax=Eleftheria terrae TaxID=1597781 RepID=UPI00263A7C35|nr:sn-glycerol-3-phosphate ABC transporter ATP-binding protein UgpC [Eleftheria terrae]WKB55844.1 sn-glycerol-3-phosphate ABC transporter ATP-binding protein UgpC [Eleftheria terrae]
MAALQVRHLEKSYPSGPRVIRGIDLEVADGELVVFVGPSGCGKSTTLRMIAGLEEVSSGEVLIGGRVVNEVPAAQRGVAMVFQSYALYPHMSVRENLGFALRLAGTARGEIEQTIHRVAATLQLQPLLDRKPAALSGGQRQRVAIGRCLVRQPQVFLFDEPLSNLDAALRVQMREEIARLHRELRTTMVYVTHDQVEAMTLADRIAVFNEGRIEQIGTPRELYERPANAFVATFIGSPSMNLVDATLHRGARDTALMLPGAARWVLPADCRVAAQDGTPFKLGLRPEHLRLVAPEAGIAARVELAEYHGGEHIVHLTLAGAAGHRLTVRLGGGQAPAPRAGDVVGIAPSPSSFHLFAADGRAVVCHCE